MVSYSFFIYCCADPRDPHSFPTRRSSDLTGTGAAGTGPAATPATGTGERATGTGRGGRGRSGSRSEEHTSELQSHSDLVCRLLLEKKKKEDQQPQHKNLHESLRRSSVE